jgi:hypothetical protein
MINVPANRAVVRVRQFSPLRKAVYIRKLEYLTYHLFRGIWKLIYFLPKYGSRDSSVGIATDYGLDNRGGGVLESW